jgi:hypothetical protein
LNNFLGRQVSSGGTETTEDIAAFNPHICVLLGNTPLRAAGVSGKITDWRGALFVSDHGPFKHRKCIASLHPAYVLREFSGYPLLKFDLIRALGEGYDSPLILPARTLVTNLDAINTCHYLDDWPAGVRCSVDIEGYLKAGGLHPVARSPTQSICIVWSRFSDLEHASLLQSCKACARRECPKSSKTSSTTTLF